MPRIGVAASFAVSFLATAFAVSDTRGQLAGPPALTTADRESLAVADSLAARLRDAVNRGASRPHLLAVAERLLALREGRLPETHRDLVAARVFVGLGTIEAGDHPGAVGALEREIEHLERQAPVDSTLLGMALNGLGRALGLIGNPEQAVRVLERAVAIDEAHLGPKAVPTRVARNNLAGAVASGGDLAAARPLLERNLAIEESMAPLDSARLGICLNNLANCVADLGDHAVGLALYQRALALRTAMYGARDHRVAITLNNLSSLAEVMGDDPLALDYMTRALEIRRAVFGDRHPLVAEFQVPRASILARLGRADEAFHEAMRGERLSREHLALAARSLSAGNALAYEQWRMAGLHVALALLTRGAADSTRVSEVSDAVVRSRAMLLNELAERRRARHESGAAAELETEWQEARQGYADLVRRGLRAAPGDPTYRARLDEARVRAERAESRYAAASASFRGARAAHGAGVREVLAALPPAAALVSYVRHSTPEVDPTGTGRPEYAALVTRAGTAPRAIRLGRASRIDSLVSAWRAEARTRTGAPEPPADAAAYRRAAAPLAVAIWEPLRPLLAGAETVFIVPDGTLQLVNFAALPSGAGYLVEEPSLLHVLTAERDLVAPPPAAAPRRVGVFGGVDYDRRDAGAGAEPVAAAGASGPGAGGSGPVAAYRGAAPDCEGLRGHAFGFLRGSDREARDLAARWPGLVPGAMVVARFGGEATEEAFKRLAPSCDALHVASHGFYADPECAGDSEDEELASNPLLLSGLALAGANLAGADPSGADPKGGNPEGADPARAEDGWLTAEEISALDLSRARWVVLSACGSGLGPLESGEGVFGLRRAFEIAGAGTVITTLWDVEDEAARAWIDALYDARFARGRPAAEAVRDASRRTLARLRQLGRSTHPRAWGAFVATGDWR